MLTRLRKAMDQKDEGFTLIELLVVMIIIGILAAIAIPTFLNQRKNGWNSGAKTDVSNFALAVESAAVDQGGDFTKVITTTTVGDPLVLATGLPDATKVIATLEFNGSQAVGVYSGAKPTATTFCLVGNNTNVPGAWWVYSKAKGGLQTASAATLAAGQALC